jgi:hypothetical protein
MTASALNAQRKSIPPSCGLARRQHEEPEVVHMRESLDRPDIQVDLLGWILNRDAELILEASSGRTTVEVLSDNAELAHGIFVNQTNVDSTRKRLRPVGAHRQGNLDIIASDTTYSE